MVVSKRRIDSERELRKTLDGLYQGSKNNEPQFGLIEIMKSRETIITAIHNIKANRGSKTVGIDEKDINAYLQMNESKLLKTVRNCLDNYFPRPVRRVYVPKRDGKKRPLGIPTILDRIIQELTRIVLEPIAEAKFYEYSFGFRPSRSIEHAQREILDRVTKSQMYIAIEGDIKGFFDHINHNKLIEIMWGMGIKDKRFLTLIKKMLKAGALEEGKTWKTEMGTPQGGIISPLLANIYLNNFDWMIAKKFQAHPARNLVALKDLRHVHRYHKKCQIIRYADDWVIFCEDREQANQLLTKCRKYLKYVLKLELSEDKTLITDLREKRMKFLGYEFFLEPTPSKRYPYSCKSLPDISRLKEKVREITKELRKINSLRDSMDNVCILEKVNAKIVGLAEFYKTCTSAHIMKSQDQKLYQTAYKKWCKLNGGQKIRWENFVISAKEVSNRPNRHEKRNDRIFYLEVEGLKIGLTKFQFTPSTIPHRWKQGISSYTFEGRIYLEKKNKGKWLKERGTIYNTDTLPIRRIGLIHKQINPRYNFEYIMNREYAFNRDRGKCRCCGIQLSPKNIHCHHIKPWLPLDKVNKVVNLASVCVYCHEKIHGLRPNAGTKTSMEKVSKFQKQLAKETTN